MSVDLLGEASPPSEAEGRPKPKRAQPAYTPEFALLWEAWPPRRRAKSDKRLAFARFQAARKRWSYDQIKGAAAAYLSDPDVRKDDWRYCCAAEVFLNGKLEAAIEAFEEGPQHAARERPTVTPDQLAEASCRYKREHGRWLSSCPPERIPDHIKARHKDLFGQGMSL